LTTEAGFVPGRKFGWTCPKEAEIRQADWDGEIIANSSGTRNLVPNGWDAHVWDKLNSKRELPRAAQPVSPLTWLNYGPGKTFKAPLNNADILTGPMSGCLLAVWTDDNNATFAAHIGTTSNKKADEPPNTTVKRNFYAMLVSLQKQNSVKGFNPLAPWSGPDINGLTDLRPPDTEGPKFFGLMTAQKSFFSLVLVKYRRLDEWVCLGVKPCTAMDNAALRDALYPPGASTPPPPPSGPHPSRPLRPPRN
jgi:hypothetical protein